MTTKMTEQMNTELAALRAQFPGAILLFCVTGGSMYNVFGDDRAALERYGGVRANKLCHVVPGRVVAKMAAAGVRFVVVTETEGDGRTYDEYPKPPDAPPPAQRLR